MSGFRGLTVAKLAERLDRPAGLLRELAASHDDLYRLVEIQTRSKSRTLTIPSAELMSLQRDLLKKLFYLLPLPDCLGHGRRRGVVWALERHQGHSHLFHADIKDFFPSVSPDRVRRALLGLGVRPVAAQLITDLVTFRNILPQGAPTSVAVGDVVLYPIDQRIRGLADRHELTYTRYVDDITLSGRGGPVERFSREVARYLQDDDWVLSDKGGLYGPDQSHRMLNAIVNRKPNVTPHYYASVRDDLRRIARFGYRPAQRDLESLASKVVWIATVNPDRHASLLRLWQEAYARVSGGAADGDECKGQSGTSDNAAPRAQALGAFAADTLG